MVEVKTLPPRHAACASRTQRDDHGLAALWTRPCAMGCPKGATFGQLARRRPSGPLWSWATVKPEGIVDFSNFPWNYSNRF
jgi:hypothetical protein